MMDPDMGIDSKQRKMKSNARAQHEAVNSRLKSFNVLSSYFRHCKEGRNRMMEKHGWCFEAVAVINQLKIAAGEKVFEDELVYAVKYH